MKRKKLTVIGSFLVAVIAISSFTTMETQEEEPKPINLKVLSKNISAEELDQTMKAFSKSLGVKCGHCHAPKSNGEEGLDFASDANLKKQITREMMKMTNKINKKYFKYHDEDGMLKQIGCATCHNGKAEPEIRRIPAR